MSTDAVMTIPSENHLKRKNGSAGGNGNDWPVDMSAGASAGAGESSTGPTSTDNRDPLRANGTNGTSTKPTAAGAAAAGTGGSGSSSASGRIGSACSRCNKAKVSSSLVLLLASSLPPFRDQPTWFDPRFIGG